ncbi:MAG: EamA family transporter [Chloroflexi bacterium]|nr:EamA family transporter [Chloroflexota bacterium]MBT4306004.1 EamA family transporter [Chloroflexota bacterium]MBT5337475.1 EamA family transporter [Chloroflexota bacterium]MBT6988758.1 EamA family transporter [Chloroflexota bacterium]
MKGKDWLAFIGLSLAWGTSFLWIKIAVEEISPFSLVVLRILFGIIGLLVVIAVRKPKWPKQNKQWLALAVIGVINVAVPFMLITWGEQYIDSGLASVLNGSVPLFSVILAHFYLTDDRLNWMKMIGVLVGFSGVVVLVYKDIQSGIQNNLLGQGAVLLAAIFYAISSVYIRKNTKGIDTIVQAILPLMAADLFLVISAPLIGGNFEMPTLPMTWVAVLWLGLVGSCVAYLLYYYLIHSVGPSRATMVTFTFPVIGVILGVSFLGEPLHWNLALGCFLVIASIMIVNRKPTKRTSME